MNTKTVWIKIPEPLLNDLNRFMKIDKRLNQSESLRYFIYRGMEDFNKRGVAALEPQAKQNIKAYIRFLDSLSSMKVEDYIPGNEPTRADQQKQEEYLNALNEA